MEPGLSMANVIFALQVAGEMVGCMDAIRRRA